MDKAKAQVGSVLRALGIYQPEQPGEADAWAQAWRLLKVKVQSLKCERKDRWDPRRAGMDDAADEVLEMMDDLHPYGGR